MIIKRVTAHAFGPITEQTLDFADGMTVICGPNESAKSSWHAAAFAALCGRRRGRGSGHAADRAFADRHRPWHGGEWAVSAVIHLDDGRRVALRHDLDGRVDCHATDLDLGTDCAAEIMHDGAPDGSRWLGLDRESFAATACVFQAQVLTVLRHADGLSQHLQRSAATAGADTTAAAAIERIDEFRRDRLGTRTPSASSPRMASRPSSRSAPTSGPLRAALEALREGQELLAAARRDRTDHEELLARAHRLRVQSDVADFTLRLHEAVALADEARAAQGRLEAAARLVTVASEATSASTPPSEIPPAMTTPPEPTPPAPAVLARISSGLRPQGRRVAATAGVAAVAAGLLLLLTPVPAIIAMLCVLGGAISAAAGLAAHDGPRTPVGGASPDRPSPRAAMTRSTRVEPPPTPDHPDLAAVRAEAEAARAGAVDAVGEFTSAELDSVRDAGPARLRELRSAARSAAEAAGAVDGALAERSARLISVNEAEERLTRAEAEVARLRGLEQTLSLTRRFLVSAQEQVHRDIAPVLVEAVRPVVEAVTGGRYVDVLIDPGTLAVRVCGQSGRWRSAQRLSYGTAEQIYLLLRVALADHLTTATESCPLLFDDVTVHADEDRTGQILDLLHRQSHRRQIILFSQSSHVRRWARDHLDARRDALYELAPIAVT